MIILVPNYQVRSSRALRSDPCAALFVFLKRTAERTAERTAVEVWIWQVAARLDLKDQDGDGSVRILPFLGPKRGNPWGSFLKSRFVLIFLIVIYFSRYHGSTADRPMFGTKMLMNWSKKQTLWLDRSPSSTPHHRVVSVENFSGDFWCAVA